MKQGWELKKLKEVCEKITDGTHQTPKYFDEGIIFLSSKNVTSGKIDWDNVKYIDEAQHLEMHKRIAPRINDILLAKNGTTGVAAIVDRDLVFDIYVSLAFLRPLDNVYPHFLLHFINSPIAKKQFNKRLKGAGVPNLHLEEIREVEISLPSIPEQHRIVSILDTAFEVIDKAKANAEQNLKNSKELFESYLQEVLDNGDWEEKTLGQLSKNKDAVVSGPFGSNLKVSDYKTEGIPILRLQNIGKGYFINKSIKYITTQKAEELKYHSFVSGDIALAKLGIPIGKTCIIPENFKSGIITADIVRIRPDLQVVNYKFLVYFLNTSLSVSQLTGNISGATRPRVNLSDVRNIVIKLPSIQEQENIVKKLDSLSMETKKLETIYQTKINDLEELKKSLLEKAFKGELKTEKIEVV